MWHVINLSNLSNISSANRNNEMQEKRDGEVKHRAIQWDGGKRLAVELSPKGTGGVLCTLK